MSPVGIETRVQYQDFFIKLQWSGGRRYSVSAESEAGESSSSFVLPAELERRAAAALESCPDSLSMLEQIGGELFGLLFSGGVRTLYERAKGRIESRRSTEGLRIRLQIDPRHPELARLHDLPWEFLCTPEEPDLLGLSCRQTLVRYLEVARGHEELPPSMPLHILAVMADPSVSGLARLDLEQERARLEEACRVSGDIRLSFLEGACLPDLHQALSAGPVHVLHFMGHGDFDEATGEGALLFEEPEGRPCPITGRILAHLIKNFPQLRLVVLNACNTARAKDLQPFGGMATALVAGGVPAVLAMQIPVADRAAIAFSEMFYRCLVGGHPVDAAAAQGRLAIYLSDPLSPQWAAPVLFLRASDGLIFAPPDLSAESSSQGVPPGSDGAVSKLASMPVDKIPEPCPLPSGSRMPLSRNPFFVGRQDDLRTLARHLKPGDTLAMGQVAIAAMTGIGGIGKTQLACEFAYRYGAYFAGGVFWMSFADPNGVPAEIAACGRGLNLHPTYESLPLDEQSFLVEQAWQRPVPRLLVFDNCEDEELLDRWRPPFGGSAVLVTSRRARWEPTLGVRTVPLGTLLRVASLELLHKFRPDVPLTDSALGAIAAELGDLPLALHLAGSFLFHYADSPSGEPAAYLESLCRGELLGHPSLQGLASKISPTRHDVHVGRTFALSVERLKPEDPTDALALVLLARAACLAPGEPIPHSLLVKTADLDKEDPEAPSRAENALGRLTALGLLEQGEAGALLMHRLVAELVEAFESREAAKSAVEKKLLVEANRLNRAGYPASLVVWQSHLRAVVEEARQREDQRAARLCGALGDHLHLIGDYLGARPYYERALTINENVLGLEHSDTAQSLNDLGNLLLSQGDFGQAREYSERALAIWEKVSGSEHQGTAQSLYSLGLTFQAQGNFAGARPYYDQALKIWEKTLGPEHRDTSLGLHNLGSLLQAQGDLTGARSYYERALAIREKVLGAEHPVTAQSLNNLGLLLQSQGDFMGARPNYEWALAIWQKTLGPEHPNTAIVLSNLGLLLQAQGDLAGARSYCEQALVIWEKALGPEHPDTAQGLNNLGCLLQDQGDLERARSYSERALTIWQRVLGPEHPHTARSLDNLGVILQREGDLAGARCHHERALAIREKVLGPDHPDTAIGLHNLGSVLKSEGDLLGARASFERAVAIREKALGTEHPDIAKSLHELGYLLEDQGDLAGARSCYERALTIEEKVLGTDNPEIADDLFILGYNLEKQEDFAGARLCYERVLAIQQKVLGAEHPDTVSSLHHLGFLLEIQDDPAEAWPYYERTLVIRENVLGKEHPDTACSLRDLGRLLWSQGDGAGAQVYYERALAIQERVLGAEHGDTVISLGSLGRLLHEQEDFAGALPYLERFLEIRERVLGPEHPDTASSLNSLGRLFQDQGDLVEAQPYLERALAIWEKVLGPEHPDTALGLNNLGVLFQSQGDLERARAYLERALEIREKVLGPEHRDTANSLNNLGTLLENWSDLSGARAYFERALEIQKKILGPEHPDTANSLSNLGAVLERQGDLGPDHPKTTMVKGNLNKLGPPTG